MITLSSHLGPGMDLIDSISFLLFSIGVYGVFIEVSHMYPFEFLH